VLVKGRVKKAGEIDKRLVTLMEQQKAAEAIKLQERQVKILEDVLSVDKEEFSGENKVEVLLELAKTGLENLKKQGITQEAKKAAHHRGYAHKRGCGRYNNMYFK